MKTYNHEWLISEWGRMGKPTVEILTGLNKVIWIPCADEDLFRPERQYRIKSKPWINWEHVHHDINWLASNDHDESHLSEKIPVIIDRDWCRYGQVNAESFSSFTQGTCDWRDSLVMRTVVIGDK